MSDAVIDDPFFSIGPNFHWNACVGEQGNEENYVDGYIGAAIGLSEHIIKNEMYGKQDSLILPILYNARHGLELVLKMTIRKLTSMSVVEGSHVKNHDILSHWTFIYKQKLGDEKLLQCICDLKAYVDSLSRIDEDGQEFRYHENRDGVKSLNEKSIVNLGVVYRGLLNLRDITNKLIDRLHQLRFEREGGAFTADLSRADLMEIARILPARTDWADSASFLPTKAYIINRYGISGRKFSLALSVIERVREMRSLIDLESSTLYLTDEKITKIVSSYGNQYSKKSYKCESAINCLEYDFEKMMNGLTMQARVRKAVSETLTIAEIADMRVIFYIGRDNFFAEHYEDDVEADIKRIKASGNPDLKFSDVFGKTNFLSCFSVGLKKIGKLNLPYEV